MHQPAIRVENLAKRYRIGAHGGGLRHRTFREAITDAASAPVRRIRSARSGAPPVSTFWALEGVSFEVRPGEVLGIIGRNGAGKSTLLKILSRITQPTRGRVEVRGRVASLLEVGTGFHSELTGRENIYLNGSILGMTRTEIRSHFDEIVSFAEIERFVDTPVKRYSSGMYLRLAFAVAAHLAPEILVIDEVLAVGDAEFQKKCLGRMEDVASQGRTVLFVSHNEAAVRRLCTSAALLRSGHLVQTGTPDEVFRSYRDRAVPAGFSTANRTHSSPYLQMVEACLSVDGLQTAELTSGSAPILTCVVQAASAVRFSPEFLVRDENSLPILFCPLGLSRGREYELPTGLHTFSYRLNLPYLAAGRYSLDLMLAETGVGFYDYLEEALTFSVSPSNHPVTGWEFRQGRGQGCSLLEVDEVELCK